MKKNIIWTKSKARLELCRTDHSHKYNWLFVPGGPGLGSESLRDLTRILDLPGTMWYLDFPGDGSNITDKDFSHWQKALIEATQEQANVILVAHSSGGMFSLATPELEKYLAGLILMDSAPNADWQKCFIKYVSAHPIAEAKRLQKLYEENPSNDLLKQLTIACASYFSTKKSLDKIVTMMGSLPFNYKSHIWAEKNFDSTYKASWVPRSLPTMIFAGDQDPITPLNLFLESNEFQRNNILIREIKNASHFPWMDNPEEVQRLFSEYCQWLESSH
jgi:pimeloyl-ACP methyl ester carboxylesterase